MLYYTLSPAAAFIFPSGLRWHLAAIVSQRRHSSSPSAAGDKERGVTRFYWHSTPDGVVARLGAIVGSQRWHLAAIVSRRRHPSFLVSRRWHLAAIVSRRRQREWGHSGSIKIRLLWSRIVISALLRHYDTTPLRHYASVRPFSIYRDKALPCSPLCRKRRYPSRWP